MSRPSTSPDKAASWLEKQLSVLDALYHRFGRDGLKDQSVAEVSLLLSAKELRFRDMTRGRDLSDDQKESNRRLELEIKDLTAYLRGLVGPLNLSELRMSRSSERPHQRDQLPQQSPRGRDTGPER